MKRKGSLKQGIAMAMVTMLLVTGCATTQKKEGKTGVAAENKTGAVTQVVKKGEQLTLGDLRKKYGETTADYADDTIFVNRDEAIEMDFGFNPYAKQNFKWSDCFQMYQDAEMKYPVKDLNFEYDADAKKMKVAPPSFGVAEVNVLPGVNVSLSGLQGNYLYNDQTSDNWGNLDRLYLEQKADLVTGEPLEKPIIHIIKIKTEIKKAPEVTYTCKENGEAYIQWKPVEGAKEYVLFTVSKDKNGLETFANVFGRTTETSWQAISEEGATEDVVMMNTMFANFISSDDEIMGGQENMNLDTGSVKYIGVIAVTDNGASPVSNLCSLNDYGSQLPYDRAYYSNEGTANELFQKSMESLPAEAFITMCDGTRATRVLEYDIDNAKVNSNSLTTEVTITATISGTKFKNDYTAIVESPDCVPEKLKALKARQDALKNKGGSVKQDIEVEEEDETPDTPGQTAEPEQTMEPEETVKPQQTEAPSGNVTATDLKITANSALSEYIATGLLNNQEAIDISAFTESKNKDTVVDAVLEAKYQNPLVLGIDGIKYDESKGILYFAYQEDAQTASKKREELAAKAKEVTGQIIKDGMSDLEKEIAINDYICKTATYDQAALENAKKNNFESVDKEFNDSFTSYGVLVKKLGVCASYASSFKLLADEVGLESIVVTGTLEGNVSHAWNRVKVDGQWRIVDSTNNDNEVIKNALLNISDSGAGSVLCQDERFVIDDKVKEYTCKDENSEYYHVQSKFFGKDAIEGALVEELKGGNDCMLRTDYNCSEEDYTAIAQKVADQVGGKFMGYHWLGVIRMQKQ